MEKFPKSDEEIKNLILFWFYKYHGQSSDSFNGQEQFTPYDKLSQDEMKFYSRLLSSNEIPVLILKTDSDNKTICTTRRFVHIESSEITELKYKDFYKHTGFKSIDVPGHKGPKIGIKTNGYIKDFGLQKIDGDVIYWKIPTGDSGFAFWNVTNKFDLIGRKYINENK